METKISLGWLLFWFIFVPPMGFAYLIWAVLFNKSMKGGEENER